jgi:hypothetical protein
MEKINLVICGDSWMCRDPQYPGTHFSELLDSRYQVTNLARAGVSNIEIGFQLKKVVELKPRYVIVAKTGSDRIEIPTVDDKDFLEPLQLEHFRPGYQQRYISSTLSTIVSKGYGFGEFESNIAPGTVQAVTEYVQYIHSYRLKKEVDQWIIEYWLDQLVKNNVPYYVVNQKFPVYTNQVILDPIYHTNFETQKIAAKWVNSHLNKIFI